MNEEDIKRMVNEMMKKTISNLLTAVLVGFAIGCWCGYLVRKVLIC